MSVQPFGRFLLSKLNAAGALGDLAQAAAKDPRFPKDGSPRDVSQLLNQHQAPPEFHEALEEAECEWHGLH